MTKGRSVMAFLALACLASAGCNPTNDIVTIHYKQVGACNGFNNGSGATSVGSNRAYVVFRVSTIENRDTAARDFNFDPNLLFLNESPPSFASTHLNLAQLNPFYATSRFVAKGTTETMNGAVIAVASTSAGNGASEANKTAYTLFHSTPAGSQGVVMVKDNQSQTTFPNTEDCTLISF